MASLGHIAVGIAAGRMWAPRGASTRELAKAMAALAALSMAPDLDVIAFALRIPYEAPFGHRGATHSIAASVLAGLGAWLLSKREGLPPLRTTIAATLVVLSKRGQHEQDDEQGAHPA